MKDTIIALAKQLIAIPSASNDIEALDQAYSLVESIFHNQPVVVKKFRKNNKPSLIITLADIQNPDIFLNGHLDVVSAKPRQFQPYIEQDRLYGRGAYDMKTACAIMIQLFNDLAKTTIPKDRVGLMLVPDEEVGGLDGTGYLVQQGYKPKELFLAGEGTDFAIERETKGVLWIKLIAKGRSSHAAYPWKGANAILALTNSLSKLSLLYPHPQDEVWQTTSVVTKITGGEAMNIVPDYSEASIDIRYVAEDLPTQIIQRIQSILEQDVTLEIILNQQPSDTKAEHSSLLRLQQLTEQVTGKPTTMVKKHGISDTKFFAKEKIAACGFGLSGKYHHHDNEYVSLSGVEDYYEILKRLILQKVA